MVDYKQRIKRLDLALDKANERIRSYESMARSAKGSVSESFEQHMADARSERDRLKRNLAKLRHDDALSWSQSDPRTGVLQVCDEIGHRLDEAFRHLDKHSG
jgi:predicted  nucleic acid-binding Zn-ribbon protein